MPLSKYKLQFTESARNDQKEFRRYIVKEFGYKGYGKNFDNKMKSAVKAIKAASSSINPPVCIIESTIFICLCIKHICFSMLWMKQQRLLL